LLRASTLYFEPTSDHLAFASERDRRTTVNGHRHCAGVAGPNANLSRGAYLLRFARFEEPLADDATVRRQANPGRAACRQPN
jgi:hypothetical protein